LAASDRGDITLKQAPLMVCSLLSGGVDTTIHGISAVLYALATSPDQWQRLRAEPSLARVAFDEAVRWESPVQTFFRTATTDVRVGDHVVPDGKKFLMFLGAANRDPRQWASTEHPDPDAFDLTRDPSGPVGFGVGIHQCIGQHVAASRPKQSSPPSAAVSPASSWPAPSAGTTTTPCAPGSPFRSI
jgi:cytochrome P450